VKITVERTGGFTGIKRRFKVDVDPAQLAQLQLSVVDETGYADRFHYRITVGTGQGSRSFSVSEEALLEVVGKLS
jgi:hypothetical protein